MAGRHPSSALGNSAAMEDYLEQILKLIDTKGYARVVDIASGLGIAQSSVTNMIQRLDAEGLLVYEKYRGITLTPDGESLARSITRRHRILTSFLQLFGLDEQTVYDDVEGMEHHISRPTLRVLEALEAHLQNEPKLLEKVRKSIQSSDL